MMFNKTESIVLIDAIIHHLRQEYYQTSRQEEKALLLYQALSLKRIVICQLHKA